MRTAFALIAIGYLFCPTIHAEWYWYAGDISQYVAHEPSSRLPSRIEEAISADLDWRILYGSYRAGVFTGLPELIREEQFNDPRLLTPLLGTQWIAGDNPSWRLICFGLDPRAPVPRGNIDRLPDWIDAHGGLAAFEKPEHLDQTAEVFGVGPVAFVGLSESGWHAACEPGGLWDSLLTNGHRAILLSSRHASSRTYVWAESTHPRHLIAALRKGAAYVAENDGIRLEVQVDNRTIGDRVSTSSDVFVRLRASARHPISAVNIIADGEIIWTAQPGTAQWETRQTLPVRDRRYLRFSLESARGAYRTLTNPVYLTADADLETGEMPIGMPDRMLPLHLSIDNVIETLISLPEDAQKRIISEYLRHPGLMYPTALVLETRDDAISNDLLRTLTRHTDREVRLGATLALVVRNIPQLPDLLLEQLNDLAPEVRAYAARMLCHYAGAFDRDQLIPLIHTADAEVAPYLIRALNPTTHDPALIHHLIRASAKADIGVAAAASDKLIELGNRNFRVIAALRDSARAGYATAVDILGAIGDSRVAEDLETLYRETAPGPLKRAIFLALQKLGADYPDRPTISAPLIQTPAIDGRLSPGEWAQAPFLPEFVLDADGRNPLQNLITRLARDSTRLLLAFDAPIQQQTGAAPVIEWIISTSPLQETPYRISIPYKSGPPNNPALDVAQTTIGNRWILESGLDLSALGIDPGSTMPYLRFNMSYISGARRWTWTPTYGNPNNSQRFGNLILQTPR